MTEGPSLGDGLVWAVFCPLFTGDFDAVTNFLTPFWSDYEGVTPRLSTWRVMWHVFIHVDLLILLIAVSFKYQSATSTSIFKETPSHGWNIGSERSRCHMPISVSNAYRPIFHWSRLLRHTIVVIDVSLWPIIMFFYFRTSQHRVITSNLSY